MIKSVCFLYYVTFTTIKNFFNELLVSVEWVNKWSHEWMDNFHSLWSLPGLISQCYHTQFLTSLFTLALPPTLCCLICSLWLCLISSPYSLFCYLPLNVGFLLTTLSYLFMKNIRPGGISSISLIGLLLIYLLSQPRPLNFTLRWWCAAASQLLHFQELWEPAAKCQTQPLL